MFSFNAPQFERKSDTEIINYTVNYFIKKICKTFSSENWKKEINIFRIII